MARDGLFQSLCENGEQHRQTGGVEALNAPARRSVAAHFARENLKFDHQGSLTFECGNDDASRNAGLSIRQEQCARIGHPAQSFFDHFEQTQFRRRPESMFGGT